MILTLKRKQMVKKKKDFLEPSDWARLVVIDKFQVLITLEWEDNIDKVITRTTVDGGLVELKYEFDTLAKAKKAFEKSEECAKVLVNYVKENCQGLFIKSKVK